MEREISKVTEPLDSAISDPCSGGKQHQAVKTLEMTRKEGGLVVMDSPSCKVTLDVFLTLSPCKVSTYLSWPTLKEEERAT